MFNPVIETQGKKLYLWGSWTVWNLWSTNALILMLAHLLTAQYDFHQVTNLQIFGDWNMCRGDISVV